MVKYGLHIRAHPDFVKMLREMKVELAVQKGRRYSDIDITEMLCNKYKHSSDIDFWRFKWK